MRTVVHSCLRSTLAIVLLLSAGCGTGSPGDNIPATESPANSQPDSRVLASDGESATTDNASGTFALAGAPVEPDRYNVGKSCVMDFEYNYTISGTLSGSLKINFRVLIDAPCQTPKGTAPEQWIAHGTFHGKLGDAEANSAFAYSGVVKLGGDVVGSMVFGPELRGELRVTGNLADDHLSYAGSVARVQGG